MESNSMNILTAADAAYLRPLSVMLYSLIRHHACRLQIYILHLGITSEQQDNFKSQIAVWGRGVQIVFVRIDLARLKGIVQNQRYQYEANLRLFMLEVLPEQMDRILWLDADIIVKGSLKKIYFAPDKGRYAAVCRDTAADSERKNLLKSLGLPQSAKYFNSGVMICYLKNMRRDLESTVFIKWMEQNPDKLKYPDQNALNVCLKGNVQWLNPDIYNLQLLRMGQKTCGAEAIRQARVLHYNTRQKPWNPVYQGAAEADFWKYAIRVLGIDDCVKHYFYKLYKRKAI